MSDKLKKEAETLKSILINLDDEHSYCETLFQEKYQILFLENFLTWQKPLGEHFRNVAAVCRAQKIPNASSIASSDGIKSSSSEECGSFTQDFIGCPLECIFETSISSIDKPSKKSNRKLKFLTKKYNFLPLDFSSCIQILDIYKAIDWKDTSNHIPLVVFCHQTNQKSMLVLGTLIKEKHIRLQLMSKGSYTMLNDFPSLPSLKEIHVGGCFNPSLTKTSASAHYDILGQPIEDSSDSSLKPCKDLKMSVDCYWENVSSILEPPIPNCNCIVKVQTPVGDEETGANERYKELMFIQDLHNYIQNGVMVWPKVSSDEEFMESVTVFMDGKKKLISNPRIVEQNIVRSTTSDEDFNTAFETAVTEPRSNMDFTDNLWDIFKNSSSLENLKRGLLFVFKELENFPVSPFVTRSNQSTIGKLVRNITNTPITLDLNGSEAIKFLLEIGIEKLRKDYIMLFVGLELVPYQSISFGLHPELISDEAVACLRKFHVVLELVIAIQKCLKLPNRPLCEFVRNTLQYYASGADIDLQHVFTFNISAIRVWPLLKSMRPSMWEISFLNSDDKNYSKQTSFQFSTTPTREHVYAQKDLNSRFPVNNACYVCTMAVMVEDDVFIMN